jgi:hypothetical protein
MPRRKSPGPDTRPDWRDPQMPCLVSTKSAGMTEWAPERVQRVSAAKLTICNEPEWRNDPTYDLKGRRRAR